MKRITLLLCLALLSGTAKAETLDFVLTGGATASGILTTVPGVFNGVPCGTTTTPGDGFISDMTGTFDGSPITFISTSSFEACNQPEIFDYGFSLGSAASSSFSAAGVTWSLSDTGLSAGIPGIGNVILSGDGYDSATFITLTPAVSTPEPSSGLLLLLGLMALVLIGIHRTSARNSPRTRFSAVP